MVDQVYLVSDDIDGREKVLFIAAKSKQSKVLMIKCCLREQHPLLFYID